MNWFLLSQLLAAMAFGCGIVSWQFRTRRSVLMCLALLTAFNSCHFWLLGRNGPAALTLLTGVRYLTAISATQLWVPVLFFTLSCAACALTYQSPVTLLAMVAIGFGTYASFQSSDRRLRICFMICNVIWLVHNSLVGTPVAVLMEAAFFVSNFWSYRRIYVLAENAHQTSEQG